MQDVRFHIERQETPIQRFSVRDNLGKAGPDCSFSGFFRTSEATERGCPPCTRDAPPAYLDASVFGTRGKPGLKILVITTFSEASLS